MTVTLSRSARLALWLVGTRLWVAAAMVLGTFFARKEPDYWHFQREGTLWFQQVPIRILDIWGRWDTMFYVDIARNGYPPMHADHAWVYNAAYFPALPALMRGLSVLLGGVNVYFTGLIVVNALLILAVIYFDRLARLDLPPEVAALAVVCLLAYPGSHFLSCVYPESTALFLGVFAVYCARQRLTLAAGLACGLAAITRSSGVMICIPVLYELCRREDGALRPTWRVLIFALPALTLGGHLLLNWRLYDDPLYFIHVQAGWGRHASFPLAPLFKFDLSLDYHLFTLWAVGLVIYGIRRRWRPGYLAMAGANVLLPLTTGLLRGIHRYMGSNFPLFLFLADALRDRRRWRQAYLSIGLVTLGLFAFKWGQGYQPN